MLKTKKRFISAILVTLMIFASITVSAEVVTINDFDCGTFDYATLRADNDTGWTCMTTSMTSLDLFIGDGEKAGWGTNGVTGGLTAEQKKALIIFANKATGVSAQRDIDTTSVGAEDKLVIEFDMMSQKGTFAEETGFVAEKYFAPGPAAFLEFLDSDSANAFTLAYRSASRVNGALNGFGCKTQTASTYSYFCGTSVTNGISSTLSSAKDWYTNAGTIKYKTVFDNKTKTVAVSVKPEEGDDANTWIDISGSVTDIDFSFTNLPSVIKINGGNGVGVRTLIDNYKVYTISGTNAVSSPKMFDKFGNAITTAAAGDRVICAANASNPSALTSSLVAASYDTDGYFLGYINHDKTFDNTSDSVSNFSYTVPATASLLRLFSLDTFENVKPYADFTYITIN